MLQTASIEGHADLLEQVVFLGVDRGGLLLRVGPPQQEHHASIAPIAHSLRGGIHYMTFSKLLNFYLQRSMQVNGSQNYNWKRRDRFSNLSPWKI